MSYEELKTQSDVLTRVFRFNLPSADFNARVERALGDLQKKLVIDGYRAGKVPVDRIKNSQKYLEVLESVVNDSLKSGLETVVKDCALDVVGKPMVSIQQYGEDRDLVYTLTLEVFPELPEIDLESLKVVRHKVDLSPEEIEKYIDGLKEYELVEIQDPAHRVQKGEVLVIDYNGLIDGKPFQGSEEQDFQLEIGADSEFTKVQEDLMGAKIGDEIDTHASLPESYLDRSIAGKVADFHIKVKQIFAKELIKDRQKLSEKFGCKNLEELQQKCKEMLLNRYDQMSFELAKLDVFKQLNTFDFAVPKSMLKQELENLKAEDKVAADAAAKKSAKATTGINEDAQGSEQLITTPSPSDDQPESGGDVKPESAGDDTLQQQDEALLARAKQRVKLALLIMRLGEKFKVEVAPEELIAILRNKHPDPKVYEYLVQLYSQNQYLMARLEGEALENKVCRHILDNVKQEENLISGKELADLFDSSKPL